MNYLMLNDDGDQIKGRTANPDESRRLAEEGMAEADAHIERIDPEWRVQAMKCIEQTAVRLQYLISDDIHDQLKAAGIDTVDQDPALRRSYGSALGALIQAARRLGWITPTGETRRSLRPTTHGSIDRIVWKSLLWQPQANTGGR